jgi:hypothetical protein
MNDRRQLRKDVGERLGRVWITSLGQFDDRQTDRPDVGRSSVAGCLPSRFALYTFRLQVS